MSRSVTVNADNNSYRILSYAVDDVECEVGLVIVERLKVFSCITPDSLSLHRVAVDRFLALY